MRDRAGCLACGYDVVASNGLRVVFRRLSVRGEVGRVVVVLEVDWPRSLNQSRTTMAMRARIFLAHAHEDKPQVRKLYADLKASGFDPWFDVEDLLPGQLWKQEIPKAIRDASAFIACLSSRSVEKSGYVQNEFRLALSALAERPPESIYLLPVRLDDCRVPDIAIPDRGLSFGDLHWVDLWENGGMERIIRALNRARVITSQGIHNRKESNPDFLKEHLFSSVEYKTREFNGFRLCLANKESKLLDFLLSHPVEILSKEIIMNVLFDSTMDKPEIKIIDVLLFKLRKKISTITGNDNYIEIVWGRGYRWQP